MKFRRIKDLREDHDYKQRQLAEYLHVKQSTYSDYENGVINVPVEAFMKMAEFYHTSVDYLLELTDDARPYRRKVKK